MARDLKDRVLLITGASSGIGAATAVEAGRAGMRVALTARRRDRLEQVAAAVREAGGEAEPIVADMLDDASIDALFARTVERFGRLDALFANAGYGYMHRGDMDGQPVDEQQIWQVNYHAAVRCCRNAAELMRPRRAGHILLCSSIVGRIGLPYYTAYASTKAALHAYAASLRLELEPHGIDVSGVYPVGTHTEFFEASAARRGSDGVRLNTPEALMQSPEHVARRVVKCLRRPRPEVWPSFVGKFGAVVLTMFPRLGNVGLRKHARGCRKLLTAAASDHDADPAEANDPASPSQG